MLPESDYYWAICISSNFEENVASVYEELACVPGAPVVCIPLHLTLTTEVILPSIQNTVGIHQQIRTLILYQASSMLKTILQSI
jgi:hypothetical protein